MINILSKYHSKITLPINTTNYVNNTEQKNNYHGSNKGKYYTMANDFAVGM